MLKNKAALLVMSATMLIVSLITATAAALRSLEIRGGEGGVTATSNLRFFTAAGEIVCEVTLLRTISRVIPKIEGTLIGRITGIAINYGNERCRRSFGITSIRKIIALNNASRETLEPDCPLIRGSTTIHLCDVSRSESRLWNLIYESFNGTLPNITTLISGADMEFKIEFETTFFGVEQCLYRGTLPITVNINRERRVTSATTAGPLGLFKRLRGTCETFEFEGTFSIAPALSIALL